MNYYESHPITRGVSYHPWFRYIEDLLREKKTPLQLESNELHELYHADCSPMDVYYINRIKTIKSTGLELTWYDDFGHESVVFTNNESIRDFYKKNPKVKEVIEAKGHKYY